VNPGGGNDFIVLSSLSDVLDLSYFACNNVELEMAVVNGKSASIFTSPISVRVHGVELRVGHYMEDPRPGFLGNSVIQFKWTAPYNPNVGSLELRVVAVDPPAFLDTPGVCGINRTFTAQLPLDVTSYELLAPEPDYLPLFGPRLFDGECTYDAWLTYTSPVGAFTSLLTVGSRCEPSVRPQPTLSFSCERTVDPVSGLLSVRLAWSYEYIATLETLTTKEVLLRYLSDKKLKTAFRIPLDPEFSQKNDVFCTADRTGFADYNETITVCSQTLCDFHGSFIPRYLPQCRMWFLGRCL
jgi:hypothetical protein